MKILNNELGELWKEVAVTYFKILLENFPDVSEVNHGSVRSVLLTAVTWYVPGRSEYKRRTLSQPYDAADSGYNAVSGELR